MTIINIPKGLSSVRHAKGRAVRLTHGVEGLDDGLGRTVDMVALLEQVSEIIW